MDCKDFQEHISPAVDRILQKSEMASFVQHADLCPACRAEYELESMTKALVCNRMGMVHTPGELARRISDQLEDEGNTVSHQPWRRIGAIPYAKPVLLVASLGIVALIVFTLFPRPSEVPPSPANPLNNVISQSLANYQAVVSGAIQPQQISNNPQNLSGFFAGKTDFPVLVPQLAGCTLVGGVLNEHAGTTLAHVVYTHDGNIVYMFEACWATVRKGQKLHLPQSVQEELLRTGLFTESQPDGKTVVLWTKGNTLCAAVARMNKDDLIACLSAGGDDRREAW